MNSSSFTLVRRFLVVLLILLAPAAARSQEQSQPTITAPSSAKTSPDQAQAPTPAEGSLIMPKTETKTDAGQAGTAQPKEANGTYVIKQGDTLWDISNTFLKDPFLWPFIWKANPTITNADLIYPGNTLIIPNLAPIERAIETPAEQEQLVEKETPAQKPVVGASARAPEASVPAPEEARAPANKLIVPDEAPVPVIDKYSMLNAGFVNPEESRDLVVGSPEGKTIMGYDDLVYVTIRSKENAAVGDRFLIFMQQNRVKHPVTGRKFGNLIRVLGVLQLVEKGKSNNFAARVTLSFDAIERGSMLTPYQEPTLIYNPQQKAKDISGYVLEVVDTRTINGQIDIVYLDKGTAEGVEPGDRFIVYTNPEKKIYPKIMIGETQVFLVKEHTSTAIVRKSTDTIAKGNMVEFKK